MIGVSFSLDSRRLALAIDLQIGCPLSSKFQDEPTCIAAADAGNVDFPSLEYAGYHFKTAVMSNIGRTL